MTTSLLIHPEELTEKWIDRAAALGYDALALHPHGGGEATDALYELLATLETAEYRALIDRAWDKGLAVEYEIHAAGYLLPRQLFAEHPEYFRMNEKGERTPDFNFCFSNTDALRVIGERAAELAARLYRSPHRYFFWADDVRGKTCHCEKCRRLSPSDKNLTFMNAILTALRKEIPDARLAYLAYQDTLPAPQTVRPEEGIFLEYAPIDRDVHRPIEGQDERTNGAVRDLIAFFGTKNAKVLDYWLDNSLFSRWKKPPVKFTPDRAVIEADVAFYKTLGFEDISSFACFLGEDYEALYGAPDIPPLVG